MARYRRPPRPSSNAMLSVLVVQALTKFLKLERKPPVTVALILINVLLFFRPGELVEIVPSLGEVCLNPHLVLKNHDWTRLILSAFMHADETHLIYNMVSFLWKGVQLEGALGSLQFAELIALLTILSQAGSILVAKLLADQLGIREPFYQQCAVGFSGVIFALKVVLSWHSSTSSTIAGFAIPTRYAAWAELLAIQYATPQASFIGHVGGIIAGLALVYIPRMLPRHLPFVAMLRALAPVTVASVETGREEEQQTRRTAWFSSWGTTGAGEENIERARGTRQGQEREGQDGIGSGGFMGSWFGASAGWTCQACTYRNTKGTGFCEMCGEARSGADSRHQGESNMAEQSDARFVDERGSPEELRRRRLERFAGTLTARR